MKKYTSAEVVVDAISSIRGISKTDANSLLKRYGVGLFIEIIFILEYPQYNYGR